MNSTEDTDDEDRKSVTVNVGCHFVKRKIFFNVVMSKNERSFCFSEQSTAKIRTFLINFFI